MVSGASVGKSRGVGAGGGVGPREGYIMYIEGTVNFS